VDDEAEQVVRRYALRCGAVGAIVSVPGTAAAAALPASALSTFALHMRMIREIARLYGHRPDTYDFETDALAIMAGDATKETLKRASVEWSHEFAWRSLQRAMAARAAQRMDAALPGDVVLVGVPRSLARLVPLAGAPVGFGIDYAYAWAVGNRAIVHYRPPATATPQAADA
jgi:uncharacterized protein (DUF697 family)